ncbi:MAG TPA: hypothetical protein PLR06_09890 [Cyclobacteriaceae bacterium]|nr:hypothetical protein [Cyclobacteriaceae bacterium]
MNTDNEKLSAQQSLDIISKMIEQAKGNVQKNSFYFLLWGWTILTCNLGIYIMIQFTDIGNPFWIWLLTIPAGIASSLHGRKQERIKSHTHLDAVNQWLWISFGVICFTIVAFGQKINWQINPIIICMSAVPTFVSGITLRFRPLILGGLSFWICGVIIFFLPVKEQFLLSSFAIAVGYLVPGYLLKSKKG